MNDAFVEMVKEKNNVFLRRLNKKSRLIFLVY